MAGGMKKKFRAFFRCRAKKGTTSNIISNDAAKLADSSISVSIPEGETWLSPCPLDGTRGYLEPECVKHEMVMEKSDVYSFGVLLFELLTGKRYFDWKFELYCARSHFEIECFRSAMGSSDSGSFRSAILPVMKCADSEGLTVVPVADSSDMESPGPIVVPVSESSENESPWPAVVPAMQYADNGSSQLAIPPATEYSDNILESNVTVTNSSDDEHQSDIVLVLIQAYQGRSNNINVIILGYKEETNDEDLFHQQLRASMDLALRCIEYEESNRPTMEEVATELKNIITSSASLVATTSTSICLQ